MSVNNKVVVFNIDHKNYALYVNVVHRILPSVEITPLPGAPSVVLGIINIEGVVIPVFNTRLRFLIKIKEIELSDKLLIVKTSKRKVALLVDDVKEVIEFNGEDLVLSKGYLPGQKFIEGVLKLGTDLILIHDVDKFLSPIEQENLDNAINDVQNY
ncbi:MAG: chemotaxis protein CheW [Bacteroidetes bacterium]|nr:chemotaxis protein CheW [Bacteroidota bacterium]